MNVTEIFAIITDRYPTAVTARCAGFGKSSLMWVRASEGLTYQASLYRVVDEDGYTYYTYVGADPHSYIFLETMRVANHGYIVKLDKFLAEYDYLVGQYLV